MRALMRGGLLAPSPSLLLTHRSPECPEGRDSWFDCLIDLLQTVRQGVPSKLGGGGSISGRGGGRGGERWERGGRQLGWNETKVPAPGHKMCRCGVGWGAHKEGGQERQKQTR